VRNLIEAGAVRTEADRADLCASFREAALAVLAAKLLSAAHSAGVKVVGVSGGVSANANLRRRVEILAEQEGIAAHFAPPALRTDNATMIAYTAALHLAARSPHAGPWRDIDLDARPHWNAANAFSSE
jgi:N6-L-threonylcarbamoyladenine synthase